MATTSVRCIKIGSKGDKEDEPISDQMIIRKDMAVSRGKRFLDEPGLYYMTKKRSYQVPHKGAAIVPRSWVTITDAVNGLSEQKVKVRSYNLSFTETAVWANMETDQYEVFDI